MAVPQPVFIGEPASDYSWPFYGSPFLLGVELGESHLDVQTRLEVTRRLALVLRCVHGEPVEAAIDADRLPLDDNHRADMRRRVPLVRQQLAEAERRGVWRGPDQVWSLLERAEALPAPSGPWRVVHGDLQFRHVLVDDHGLRGVIDWIDLGRSDPPIDLAVTWSSLTTAERAVFFAEYGPVSDEQLIRARVVALSVCAALANYSHDQGLPGLLHAAVTGLEQTCTA